MYVFGNESSNEAIVKSFILTGLPDSTSRIDRFFSFYLKNVQKRLFFVYRLVVLPDQLPPPLCHIISFSGLRFVRV